MENDKTKRLIAACMNHLAESTEEWVTGGTSRTCFSMPETDFDCFISVEKSLTKDGWRIVPAVVKKGEDKMVSCNFDAMGKDEMINALTNDQVRSEVSEQLMSFIQKYDD